MIQQAIADTWKQTWIGAAFSGFLTFIGVTAASGTGTFMAYLAGLLPAIVFIAVFTILTVQEIERAKYRAKHNMYRYM